MNSNSPNDEASKINQTSGIKSEARNACDLDQGS